MVGNNPFTGSKAIDQGIDIPRENFSSFAQGRSQQVFCQRVSSDESVNAFAGIVRVELNDAAEMASPKFVLQNLDFGLSGCSPKFAVQVMPAPGVPAIVFKTRRIADGINLKQEVFGERM